jgi:ferredoxin
MSYRIVAVTCTGCTACEPLCPNGAIRESGRVYRIEPALCTRCEGFYDEPQCLAICPIEFTIVPDLREETACA